MWNEMGNEQERKSGKAERIVRTNRRAWITKGRREIDAETNQWHMIVCIYCRTDSFASSHVVKRHTQREWESERENTRTIVYVTLAVCVSECVYVFQLWDVRSKIIVVVVVVVGASLCIRLCRCWSLDIIWRHIILYYLALVLAFVWVCCMYVNVSLFHDISVRTCTILLLLTFYLTVSFTPYKIGT